MWLKPTDRPPTRHHSGGWAIRMLNADTPVIVKVTDAALHNAVSPNATGGNIFTYRHLFEEIAGEKFHRHQLDADGSITIGPADLNGY